MSAIFATNRSAAETCATVPPDRVDFIDEDDAWGMLLRLVEHIAHTRGADADEHLDKVRTGDREERNVCFTGNRAGQQGLTRSRRSHHQNALGNTSAEFLKLLRFLEKLDDLLELFFRFFNTSHILERHAFLLVVEQLRARLAKRQRFVAA